MSSGGEGETPIEMLHHPNSSSTTAEGEGTAVRAAPCFPETRHDKNVSFHRVWVRACLFFFHCLRQVVFADKRVPEFVRNALTSGSSCSASDVCVDPADHRTLRRLM